MREPSGRCQREVHARADLAHVLGAHVGLRIEAVGHHVARRVLRQRRDFRIVDAQHRQPVERQAMQEFGEGFLHLREVAAVVLEMVGVDVGDHRDRGIQAQERAVAFVGFGDQPLAAAEARVRARGEQLAADDEGRVHPAFAQHAGGQRRRGRLAVRAGHRDAAAEAHEFGEHLGARHDRNALRARFHQFRIVLADRAGHDDAIGVEHVRRAVAAMHLRAELREATRDRVVRVVGARHLVAERAQHFGDAAHADAADADEVHARIRLGEIAGGLQAALDVGHHAASLCDLVEARDFLEHDLRRRARPHRDARSHARLRPSRCAGRDWRAGRSARCASWSAS